MALGFSEVGYRIYGVLFKPLYRPSSVEGLGWEFTPHATNAARGKQPGPTAYLINDRGFRDRTNGNWIPWRADDLKMVILGDSVTAGPNVGYGDTYSAKLEEMLQQRGGAVRVVNGGVDATNTRQQFAWLRHKGLPLKPDFVLLGYFMNDVESRSFENLPGPVRLFLRHFHLGVFLSQRIVQTIRNRRETSRYQADLNPGAQRPSVCSGYVQETLLMYQTQKWSETAGWIQHIRDLCRANGIQFGVLIFPFQDQVAGVCPMEAQGKIFEFLAKNKIPHLDMSKALSRVGRGTLYLPGDPMHLNAEGHRAAADEIDKWLQEKNLFPFS